MAEQIAEIDLNFPGRKGTFWVPEKSYGFLARNFKYPLGYHEIWRQLDTKDLKASVFDMDGTLIKERDPWMDWQFSIFLKAHSDAGLRTPTFDEKNLEESYRVQARDPIFIELQNAALPIFEKTIGLPSVYQIIGWSDYIYEKSGIRIDNMKYLLDYKRLRQQKVEEVRRQTRSRDDLVMAGAGDMLKSAKRSFNNNVYIATGTDEDEAKDTLRFYGIDKIVSLENVVGASSSSPEICAKEIIAKQIREEVGGRQVWRFSS